MKTWIHFIFVDDNEAVTKQTRRSVMLYVMACPVTLFVGLISRLGQKQVLKIWSLCLVDRASFITTLFLFQLDTLLFFFLPLQFFSYNFSLTIFLYMFRTAWSIIRRIKLHLQHLAPFPHSLLSRVWPLVLTESVSTNGHTRDNNEWGKSARCCTCNLILLMMDQPVRNM